MKYVFLAIFVLLAAQPMRASSCNMHHAQPTGHHASHDMDHGNGQDMDCCDHEPAMPPDHCDSMFHCGACPAGLLTLDTPALNTGFKTCSRVFPTDAGEPLSNFIPPPYKPPIA